jgi:hypothetical protein
MLRLRIPMRTFASAVLLAVFLALGLGVGAPRLARADAGNFGLGLIVGSPTGLSAKLYLASRGHAIDAAVGLTTIGADGLHVHADYLWHPFILARESSFDLAAYVGIGGRVLDHDRGHGHDDDFHIGPRAPIGVVFDFLRGDVPLDVFAEVALVLDFVLNDDDDEGHDGVDLDLNAGVGARYYF